ncbi:hypothetical protein F5I97DRAFT_37624 [Phlebopus sp. FC_14]|nr:hypothetical protein F5I97DRAFT_37624 [Phlebopus sp. FC_14]
MSDAGSRERQADELREQAIQAATGGKFDEAIALYEKSLALNPSNFRTYAERSISRALACKDLGQALEDAEMSLALKVTADGYEAKGMSLKALDRLNEAVIAFDEALKIADGDYDTCRLLRQVEGNTYNDMAKKAYSAGDYTEAARLYGIAHSSWPFEPTYLANRSDARRQLEQWDLAVADAEEKARAYSGQRRYAEAVSAINGGLALDNDDQELKDLKVSRLIKFKML